MAPIRPSLSRAPLVNHSSSNPSTRRFRDPYAIPHRQNKAHTKVQKYFVKHATLLSRLQRTVPGSKVTKRRRPSNKLVTDLQDLENALPSTSNDRSRTQGRTLPSGKVKQKTLKSRPGAMKRKEKLMTAERERFAKNLALMAAGQNENTKNARFPGSMEVGKPEEMPKIQTASNSRARWAAIRDHIGRTMEMVGHGNGSS